MKPAYGGLYDNLPAPLQEANKDSTQNKESNPSVQEPKVEDVKKGIANSAKR